MIETIGNILHNLTHNHQFTGKDGVGMFCSCQPHWSRRRCNVAFRPATGGAKWHRVPVTDGEALLNTMMRCTTPEQAMAALRTYKGEDHAG